ncbi:MULTISPECIES: hypothetical protein [Streptomyces]|uniref:Uncharacterized protein n=1 Tax=Streptomyces coelicoflavus TaxID=285562 RepID=A0A6N9UCD9_9ACTN|nr:hypothetical protein [Streptomyces sp. CS159]NEB15438.1 hypothetical protein [Streptomyces coelicoflavus]OWA07555.1 hypothetical protein B9W64_25795 [Streptomyces sp. CS159]
MAYSLGLYSFSDGELAAFDMDVVRAVLSPVAAVPEEVIDGATECWIRAADGSEAEVSVSGGLICVIRPQAGDVWKIIVELADRLRAAVLLPDGTLLCREETRGHLPEGMEHDAVLVPEITLAAFERAAGPFTHPLA